MKQAKRITALLLVLLMTGSSILSCGSGKTADETQNSAKTEAEAAETTTTAETEAETEFEDPFASRTLQDTVPELDFGGADFRSMTQPDKSVLDIYAAEITGEILNDAVYNRNLTISDRFNVNIIEPQSFTWDILGTQIRSTVSSGDDAYDLVLGQMAETSNSVRSGYLRNWLELPYVNFENPWYPKSIMQEGLATINGKMYMAVSDMLLTYARDVWAIAYDHVYAENYGITDVYETVREGKWTLDKLIEWTKDIYVDTNGNGEKDDSDFFGLSYRAEGCSFVGSLYALGLRTVEIQDQQAVMILNTETNASIFEKLYSMLQNPGTMQMPYQGAWPVMMENGKTIFQTMNFSQIQNNLREYEHAFGVIPLPKWSEEQQEYCSTADAGCHVMAVLTTAKNEEMIGAVTEALSAESWRSVMPVFCDVTLGTKTARDAESREMIQLILDSRFIDFAYLYNGWDGWTFKMAEFVANEGIFASTYAKYQKRVQGHYKNILKFFYE